MATYPQTRLLENENPCFLMHVEARLPGPFSDSLAKPK